MPRSHPAHPTRRALLAAALGAAATAPAAFAQPAAKADGPLRFVVGYTPGGASDRAARLVAQALEAKYGLQVLVENKPGAGGRLAAQQLRLAKPGEAALMLANPAVMTVAPIVYKDHLYEPADFVPVSHVTSYDFAVVVGAQVPVRELTHLIAWLKANPEKAFFGVPATGSLPHFFALMLGQRAGVRTEVVGYKGSSALATELVGGQIPVAVDTLDAVLPLHQAGRLRILAVSGKARSPFAKELPTLAESGVDVVADGWNAFFAPKSMPAARVAELAKQIEAVMADPAVRQQFVAGSLQPVSASQAQTAAMLKAYNAQWQPVVQRSGFQP